MPTVMDLFKTCKFFYFLRTMAFNGDNDQMCLN